MQPLDVAFYAPLKKYWREILSNWKKTSGRRLPSLTKDAFPGLLSKLQEKLEEGERGSHNVVSGFSKTGLYPLDPSRPKERLPQRQEPEAIHNLVSDVVVNILKDMRAGDQTVKVARRKKLNVEPGKSVSANDLSMASTSGLQKQSKRSSAVTSDECDDEVTEPQTATLSPENMEDEFLTDNSDDADDLPIINIKNSKKGHCIAGTSTDSEEGQSEKVESETFSDNSDDLPLINLRRFLRKSKSARMSNSESDKENEPEQKEGDWVIVEYKTKKSQKHFIGQVKSMFDSRLNVQFLKKAQKTGGFIWPTVEDTDSISPDMAVKILDPPSLKGTGRRKFYFFNIDLIPFHF